MHFYSLLCFFALVFSINIGLIDNATISCKKDSKCHVTQRICALCVSIHSNITLYPSCTSPICIDNKCGILEPCSLQLTGRCQCDNDCLRNFHCVDCVQNKVPFCTTARCIDGKCALINPCTITLE